MGGWIALRLAEALRGSGRIAGMVLIAPAVDMTRKLMWDTWTEEGAEGTGRRPASTASRATIPTSPISSRARLIEDGDAPPLSATG